MPDPSLLKRHWPFWEFFVNEHKLEVTKGDWEDAKNDRQMLETCYQALWESYDYLSERSSEQW